MGLLSLRLHLIRPGTSKRAVVPFGRAGDASRRVALLETSFAVRRQVDELQSTDLLAAPGMPAGPVPLEGMRERPSGWPALCSQGQPARPAPPGSGFALIRL